MSSGIIGFKTWSPNNHFFGLDPLMAFFWQQNRENCQTVTSKWAITVRSFPFFQLPHILNLFYVILPVFISPTDDEKLQYICQQFYRSILLVLVLCRHVQLICLKPMMEWTPELQKLLIWQQINPELIFFRGQTNWWLGKSWTNCSSFHLSWLFMGTPALEAVYSFYNKSRSLSGQHILSSLVETKKKTVQNTVG